MLIINVETIVKIFKERTGHYPQQVLVDKIYRNNLNYCKNKGIRLNGHNLRCSRKDNVDDKNIAYIDLCAGNELEGKLGEGKRQYGLNHIY